MTTKDRILSTLNKSLRVLTILVITLAGFGLRYYAANHLWLESDEKVYLQAARIYNLDIRNGAMNQFAWESFNYEHPPLYKIVYGFALLAETPLEKYEKSDFVFGIPLESVAGKQWVLAERYVSVFFGSLTTLVLAAMNPLAGIFYAGDTFAVKYNASIFLESLPVLTSLLSAICYLSWYDSVCEKNTREKWPLLGLSAVFLGISAASKYIYGVVGMAIAIHFLINLLSKKVRPKTFWRLGAWGVLALAAFFAFDPYLWVHTFSRLLETVNFHLDHSQSDAVASSNLPFWQPFVWFSAPFSTFSTYTSGSFLVEPDTIIAMLGLIGLPRLFRRQPFYFIWLVSGLVVLLLWPTKWQQYTMIVMVPLCTSAEAGISGLFDFLKSVWSLGRKQVQKIEHSRKI